MTLSESAEKGRKTARTAQTLCIIAAVLSVLSLNIPFAIIGFWAARHIKDGDMGARNIELVMCAANVPLMILIGVIIFSQDEISLYIIAPLFAVCGIVYLLLLSVLLGSKELNDYLREMSRGENGKGT